MKPPRSSGKPTRKPAGNPSERAGGRPAGRPGGHPGAPAGGPAFDKGPRGAARGGPRPPPRSERKDPHATQDFFVDGVSALAEYARFKPESILAVEATPQHKAAVETLLADNGLDHKVAELQRRDPSRGDEFAPVRARVRIKALDYEIFVQRTAAREHDLILAVDHITDPRNLGAVVRSAAFFGVREVIAPERRQVLFTQASVATAQGGFALTDLVCVVNLSRTLDELKERGYWIVGAAMDGVPYAGLVGKYEKVVLVLGSEDSGLAQKVREHCDVLAAIPSKGMGLESLNVSVAAGIFLSALAP